jgi:hypothetical protein
MTNEHSGVIEFVKGVDFETLDQMFIVKVKSRKQGNEFTIVYTTEK